MYKEENIILIVNHPHSLNLGSKALLYSSIDLINETFNPKQIIVLSFKPDYEIKHNKLPRKVVFLPSPLRMPSSTIEFFLILWEALFIFVWAVLYRFTLIDIDSFFSEKNRRITEAFKKATAIFIRGGDTLSDFYGLKSLLLQIYNIALAEILEKKTILFGHTIGPFRRRITMKIVLLFIKKVSYILVRDVSSYRMLVSNSVDIHKIKFLPDVAFTLSPSATSLPRNIVNHQGLIVGLVPSALVYRYGFEDLKDCAKYKKYTSLLAQITDYIIETYNAKVLLIPHVMYPGNDDRIVAKDVYRKIKNKDDVAIVVEYDPHIVKGIISKLDLLISPRMHPIIHALSSRVPVIGIDYNNKIYDMMAFLGLEHFIIRIADISIQSLKEKIDEAVSNLGKISNIISNANIINIHALKKNYMTLLMRLQGI
ncbi:MAG: polysaccharide pyruvyl transferase family protein [Candidatus Njordarchaeales archaeon]